LNLEGRKKGGEEGCRTNEGVKNFTRRGGNRKGKTRRNGTMRRKEEIKLMIEINGVYRGGGGAANYYNQRLKG